MEYIPDGVRLHEFRIKRWLLGETIADQSLKSSLTQVITPICAKITKLCQPNSNADLGIESVREHLNQLNTLVDYLHDLENALMENHEQFVDHINSIAATLGIPGEADNKRNELSKILTFMEGFRQKNDGLYSIIIPDTDKTSFKNTDSEYQAERQNIVYWTGYAAFSNIQAQLSEIKSLRLRVDKHLSNIESAGKMDAGLDVDQGVLNEYNQWKQSVNQKGSPVEWALANCEMLDNTPDAAKTYWHLKPIRFHSIGQDTRNPVRDLRLIFQNEVLAIQTLRGVLEDVEHVLAPILPDALRAACCRADYLDAVKELFRWYGLEFPTDFVVDSARPNKDLVQKTNNLLIQAVEQASQREKPIKDRFRLPDRDRLPKSPTSILEWYVKVCWLSENHLSSADTQAWHSREYKTLVERLKQKIDGINLHTDLFINKCKSLQVRAAQWELLLADVDLKEDKYIQHLDANPNAVEKILSRLGILPKANPADLGDVTTALAKAIEHAPMNPQAREKAKIYELIVDTSYCRQCEMN